MIRVLFILFILTSVCYSQEARINDKGDTTICFTIPQSKVLLKKINALNECDTLRSICEKQLTYCDSSFKKSEEIQKTMQQIIKADKLLLENCKDEVSALREEVKKANQRTNIERFKKTLWIGATALVSGIFGYYLITQ